MCQARASTTCFSRGDCNEEKKRSFALAAHKTAEQIMHSFPTLLVTQGQEKANRNWRSHF